MTTLHNQPIQVHKIMVQWQFRRVSGLENWSHENACSYLISVGKEIVASQYLFPAH
jgi:hypothetical protein